MSIRFSKSFIGFKPSEVIQEIEQMDTRYQEKEALLQVEIEKAREELQKSREMVGELQKKMDAYLQREHMIAEVMVIAQKNAARIEEESKEKARIMLEECERELITKNQELDFLRKKVARFKEEFREILENYRYSLEAMREPSAEGPFTPKLVASESTQLIDKAQDVSS